MWSMVPHPPLPQFTEMINELREGGKEGGRERERARNRSTNHGSPSRDCLKQQPGRGGKGKDVAKGTILQTDAQMSLA